MDQVPIVKIGQTLFVSIQIDLQDDTVCACRKTWLTSWSSPGRAG